MLWPVIIWVVLLLALGWAALPIILLWVLALVVYIVAQP